MGNLRSQESIQQHRRASVATSITVPSAQPSINPVGVRLRNIISKLAAMYKIPSTHPLASLTPFSGSKAADCGTRQIS
jgi:hypothetical protein